MTESLNNLSVSRHIYTDLKSAFSSYMQNAKNIVAKDTSEKETQIDIKNGQFTRKAFADIQSNLSVKAKANENAKTETEKNIHLGQDLDGAIKNSRENAREANEKKTEKAANDGAQGEIKEFTLPQNTEIIVAELRRNGLYRTLSQYDIAKEYGISYMKAREILDELQKDSNGFIREVKLPENSTVSYKV